MRFVLSNIVMPVAFALSIVLLLLPLRARAETRLFMSLDSTFLEKKHTGLHTRLDNESNPFANIYGISLGSSFSIPETKISLTLKTNRLINFPITHSGKTYYDNTYLRDSSVRTKLISDVIVASYYLGNGVMPFIFVSNTAIESKITNNLGVFHNKISSIYEGFGLVLFLNKQVGVNIAWVLPNKRASTRNGINIGLSYAFLSI